MLMIKPTDRICMRLAPYVRKRPPKPKEKGEKRACGILTNAHDQTYTLGRPFALRLCLSSYSGSGLGARGMNQSARDCSSGMCRARCSFVVSSGLLNQLCTRNSGEGSVASVKIASQSAASYSCGCIMLYRNDVTPPLALTSGAAPKKLWKSSIAPASTAAMK